MLSADDRIRVEDAVRTAERDTAGEIVVVLARQASDYRIVPLLYGLLAAVLTPWILIAASRLAPTWIALAELAVTLVVVLALSPPRIRVALAPGAMRRTFAREAAQREFAGRGMADTRGRTGILLYVAEAERHAEVIGDVTIAREVDEAEWRSVIEDLVGGLGGGRPADGLVEAVTRIGAVLARHVPRGAGDVDELPNRIVVL